METFTINISGGTRRATENGRKYLVAPATILVGDQVLNGSKGKLFYSSRRCALNVGEWNKQPIVRNHPQVDGRAASAHTPDGKLSPEILRQFGLGETRNDSWNGRQRTVDLWFDEEHTRNKCPATHQRLVKNQSFELSTGLFTKDIPVQNGRSPSGDEYTHEVEDWTPDHLAILPDQVGACSRKMGCGVNNAEGVCKNCGGQGGTPGPCPEGSNTIKPGTPEHDAYLKRQSDASQKIVDKLNNPQPKKMSAKQVKEKEDRSVQDKLAKMPVEEKHALAKEHGVDPSLYQNDFNLHREIGRIPAARAKILATNSEEPTDNAKYTFDAEKCPKCGASMEGDPDSGKCNSCGYMWGTPTTTDNAEKRTLLQKLGEWLGITDNSMGRGNFSLGKRSQHADELSTAADRASLDATDEAGHTSWDETMSAHNLGEDGVCTNCGGQGGKPGPCPGEGDSADSLSKHAEKLSDVARQQKGISGHQNDARAKAHEAAFVAHQHAAEQHQYAGNISKMKYHDERAKYHLGVATASAKQGMRTNNSEGDDMFNKAEAVKDLTANCECWKGKEKALNAMDEDALAILAKQAEEARKGVTANSLLKEIAKSTGAPADLTLNAMPAFIQAKMDAKKKKEDAADGGADDSEEDDAGDKKKVTGNRDISKLPVEQRLAPDEIATLNFAREIEQGVKKQLVDKIVTTNASSDAHRKAIRPVYEKMDIKTLRQLVAELPQQGQTNNRSARQEEVDTILDFSGAGGGGYAANRGNVYGEPDPDDVLEPTFNAAKYEAELLAKEAAAK